MLIIWLMMKSTRTQSTAQDLRAFLTLTGAAEMAQGLKHMLHKCGAQFGSPEPTSIPGGCGGLPVFSAPEGRDRGSPRTRASHIDELWV